MGRSVGGGSLFLFSYIRNPAQLTAALYGYESLPVSLRIGENSRYLAFTGRHMQIFFLPHSLTNSFIILSLLNFFSEMCFFHVTKFLSFLIEVVEHFSMLYLLSISSKF